MKRLLAMFLCVGLCTVLGLGATGCGKDKEKDKTPKKDESVKQTGKDTKLTVAAGSASVTIKQGKSDSVDVTVVRGKDIKEITFKAEAGTGITVALSPDKLGATKTETKVTIDVAKTVKAGDYTVSVTATPDAGTAATVKIGVKVEGEAAPKTDDTKPDDKTKKVDDAKPDDKTKKVDKDAPKTDKDAPKKEKDAPKTDKDAPKTDKDAPKTDKDAKKDASLQIQRPILARNSVNYVIANSRFVRQVLGRNELS